MPQPATAGGPKAASTNPNKIGAVAVLAASVEWYDFFIFGTAAALVFSSQYFTGDPLAATLAAFATFAVGFAARPIGGIIAGNLGDRIGRIPVLVLALVVMGAATALIGLLPNFAAIGIAAPILLVLLRIAQGLAVGAQWGGAVLLATEYAPPEKRGLFGSLVQLGVPIGLILANVTFLVLAAVLTPAQFDAWGWRIAFIPSILIVLLGLWVKRNVPETPDFQTTEAAATDGAPKASPMGTIFRKHWKLLLMATGSVAIVHALFYTMITGLLEYAARPGAEGGLGMESSTVLAAILVSSVFQLGMLPLFARISDRIGRVRMYRIGAVGVLVAVFPMLFLIEGGNFWSVFAGLMLGSIALSMIYGPQAALFAELFDPEVRYSGASTGYQLGAVLGGGLAPFILVLVVDATGSSIAMGFYLGGLALLSLLCIYLIGRSDAGRRVGAEEAERAGRTGAAGQPRTAQPASPS